MFKGEQLIYINCSQEKHLLFSVGQSIVYSGDQVLKHSCKKLTEGLLIWNAALMQSTASRV